MRQEGISDSQTKTEVSIHHLCCVLCVNEREEERQYNGIADCFESLNFDQHRRQRIIHIHTHTRTFNFMSIQFEKNEMER